MKFVFPLIAAAAMVATTMPAYANEKNMEEKAQYYFQKIDANGDGAISKDEHVAFGDKMFDDADTDNNDSLSLAELTAAKEKEKAAHKATKQ